MDDLEWNFDFNIDTPTHTGSNLKVQTLLYQMKTNTSLERPITFFTLFFYEVPSYQTSSTNHTQRKRLVNWRTQTGHAKQYVDSEIDKTQDYR